MLVNCGSTANGSSSILVGRLPCEFSVERKSSLDSHSSLCSKQTIMKLCQIFQMVHERISITVRQTDGQTDRRIMAKGHRQLPLTTRLTIFERQQSFQ